MKKAFSFLSLIFLASLIYAGIEIAGYSNNTYLITIGIDKFSETNWNLNYCVADAEGIYNSFPGITQENKILLTNENATKLSIEENVTIFANRLKENDTLIVFVATHGFFNSDDYYFTPHDFKFDNISNNYMGDIQTGISSNWLLELFYDKVRNNSNDIILILDTCHSGSMGFDVRRSYNENTGTGLALLYSCSPLELSFENILYGGGHGLFSYCVIDGLTGKADKNNDSRITFRELFDYAYLKVKELSNDRQNPVFIGAMRNETIIKIIE